jgi:hypothetical protein
VLLNRSVKYNATTTGRRIDGKRAAHDIGDGAEALRGNGGGGRSDSVLASEPRRAQPRWCGAAHGSGGLAVSTSFVLSHERGARGRRVIPGR